MIDKLIVVYRVKEKFAMEAISRPGLHDRFKKNWFSWDISYLPACSIQALDDKTLT